MQQEIEEPSDVFSMYFFHNFFNYYYFILYKNVVYLYDDEDETFYLDAHL